MNQPNILTNEGKYFEFLLPGNHEFTVTEIAHALSHICRFTGHVREFYSVAQHSYLASCIVPKEHALSALMHDASEAYLGDVSSPLKSMMPDYKALELEVEAALFAKLGLPFPMHPCIKQADLRLLMTERRDLLPPDRVVVENNAFWANVVPLPFIIHPVTPEKSKRLFLDRYKELTQ